jgi:glutathione-regulated potassium-efflux system ancillary protein KefG
MARVLILFAHPALEKSRVHDAMVRQVRNLDGVTFHDLYEAYPDFDIDVAKEQQLLLSHDLIIMQHPFYWYSSPAILKQWQDLVLKHNWAYGPGGNQLSGKRIFNAISCGGSREAYSETGRNRLTVPQLLSPFRQTAQLCKMEYLPPFVIHGTHKLKKLQIDYYALQYRQLIFDFCIEQIRPPDWEKLVYLNDMLPELSIIQN